MKRYITIDGGTTNTRLCLIVDGKIADTLKTKSEGDGSVYKAELKKKTAELLRRNSLPRPSWCGAVRSFYAKSPRHLDVCLR